MTYPASMSELLSSFLGDIAGASFALAASVDGLLMGFAGRSMQPDELDRLAAITASMTGAAGALVREDDGIVDIVMLTLQDENLFILSMPPNQGTLFLVIVGGSEDVDDVLAGLKRARARMTDALMQ